MTFRFKQNELMISDYQNSLIYKFKEFMKSTSPDGPGWTVKLSSDGTNYGSGDFFTDYTTGSSIWFVLKSPNNRELLFQGSGGSFSISYSSTSGYVGGDALTAPTASDNQSILGSADWFTCNAGTIMQIGADDSNNYSFFIVFYNQNSNEEGSLLGGLYMDEIDGNIYVDEVDIDPVVFYISRGGASYYPFLYTSLSSISSVLTNSRCVSWCFKGSSKESFSNCPGLFIPIYPSIFTLSIPRSTMKNIDGSINLFPIIYSSANYCCKGIGKNFKYISSYNFEDYAGVYTVSKITKNDILVVGDITFPWNGSSVL